MTESISRPGMPGRVEPHRGRSFPIAPSSPLWRRAIRGMTLVELLVALAIGGLVLIGTLGVFAESRKAFRSVDAMARLHEHARLAFALIESDLRMAGHWGPAARASGIEGQAGPLEPVPAGLAVRNDCGANWTLRLDEPVQAARGYDWSCAPFGGEAHAAADTLVVRRLAAAPVDPPPDGVLHVRAGHSGAGRLFVGGDVTAGASGEGPSRTHQLVINGYYVSPTSTLSRPGRPVPSLRVKTLRGGALGPRILDEEVLPGVEDLRIELGMDTDAPTAPGRGTVNRYVTPGDPLLDPAPGSPLRLLAVRVWLRVRAEEPEPGYVDTARYDYAGRREPPPGDGFRRLVIARTVYLRNAAGTP